MAVQKSFAVSKVIVGNQMVVEDEGHCMAVVRTARISGEEVAAFTHRTGINGLLKDYAKKQALDNLVLNIRDFRSAILCLKNCDLVQFYCNRQHF